MASSNPFPLLMTFRDKMDHMRKVVKEWQYKKRQSNNNDLWKIQKALDRASEAMVAHHLSFKMRCHIKELQKKKIKILE